MKFIHSLNKYLRVFCVLAAVLGAEGTRGYRDKEDKSWHMNH